MTKAVDLPLYVAMSQIDQILTLGHAYAKAEGVELSTVSWRALGDTRKLRALETGSDIQTKRAAAALEWFEKNWPDGVEWPLTVEGAA